MFIVYTENGQCPAFDAPSGSWQEGEEAQFKKADSLVDLAFRHDRGEEEREHGGEDGDALFREAYVVLDEMLRGHPAFYRSAAFWGLALRRQAEEKPDQEAVELLEDAEDKFRHAEAASDVSIKCYALSGEGLALAARGARTRGPKRDSLYDQACAKDREALNADPQYHLAANNWGDALRAQAEGKPDQEAIALLEEAGRKYQTAAAASDLIVKCRALNGGGLALAARAALAKKPEERDRLYEQAYTKYGEALKVDPQYYWADNNWGDALRTQANRKPDQEAIPLLEEAGHKYETAEAASDLIAKCHALTGGGRVLAARAALAKKREERDRLYGQAYAKRV